MHNLKMNEKSFKKKNSGRAGSKNDRYSTYAKFSELVTLLTP